MLHYAFSEKKIIFFDIDIVVKKKKLKCGLKWSVRILLPTNSTCHQSGQNVVDSLGCATVMKHTPC